MCGIVGLHLRTPELYPRLGELLTGMLCEMGNRGSDSTGVAVYGDPLWSPPGRGVVSVVDVSDDAVTERILSRGQGREDDNPETVRERLHVYHGETEPLIEYYARRDLLRRVDGKGEPADVEQRLRDALG